MAGVLPPLFSAPPLFVAGRSFCWQQLAILTAKNEKKRKVCLLVAVVFIDFLSSGLCFWKWQDCVYGNSCIVLWKGSIVRVEVAGL